MRWIPATMIFCVLLVFKLSGAPVMDDWIWAEVCSPMIFIAIVLLPFDLVRWVSGLRKQNVLTSANPGVPPTYR